MPYMTGFNVYILFNSILNCTIMKHLLILFLLVSFSANATAALFDSNDQNSSKVKSSTNYSSNSASVKKCQVSQRCSTKSL